MAQRETSFGKVVKALEAHYGPPAPPPASDPLQLILYESIGYLSGNDRRQAAFNALREQVGLTPAAITHSLKGYTSFRANRLLGREGEFWSHESYDHYIRDVEERRRVIAYVLNNPVKAGYVDDWRAWKWNYRGK